MVSPVVEGREERRGRRVASLWTGYPHVAFTHEAVEFLHGDAPSAPDLVDFSRVDVSGVFEMESRQVGDPYGSSKLS
jgi:hypothetical protein